MILCMDEVHGAFLQVPVLLISLPMNFLPARFFVAWLVQKGDDLGINHQESLEKGAQLCPICSALTVGGPNPFLLHHLNP